jgi:hypothetical protein
MQIDELAVMNTIHSLLCEAIVLESVYSISSRLIVCVRLL